MVFVSVFSGGTGQRRRERERSIILGSGKMTQAQNLGAICHDSHGYSQNTL